MNVDSQLIMLNLDEQKSLELFVARPASDASLRGAILFVHGHQDNPRTGGRDIAENGMLSRFANWRSVIAASVSQPGYGRSSGPPDFCGPATQIAIRLALDFLEEEYGVGRSSTVLYGVSRGAIAGAMVATQEPTLGGVILVAGMYDLETTYETTLPGIRSNIESEAGTTKEAFAIRSALLQADRIRAEAYILHGRQDERAPVEQAIRFAEIVKRNAVVALSLFDCGHFVPFPLRRPVVLPLYDRVFGEGPGSSLKS
ncbi:prolyl oligopeptidase family serine peptidase [Rhizobium sp. CG5]|uniref:alpha/beta hydrolase family protein n=1 Tax=Rhizobium sp. CG5 TaxID=2726076 RepID=UPI002033A015|nr:prolyl oligopeptidase family serine peptidase [Rhizobium sp. CG5]